ncbi:PRA1 family protein F2 [Galdieria sulphuraria]|uniref:PRA1 family protein n=1 Tax=Galdieria sulphuraria TaxID=130081 RepID=M2XU19_GALSU|nr:uncharacterized protein Gasu_54760 [Galdieria sulphuraria]EME26904.1 hypothetical protein Gasu_54760 [Galdieria sulphuraria]GJD10630.1 PRA1 family protein F2 [Galdieria sulphuraria]|eukprot:XP_005703424.1 hypothetical protein Gasu_54760 [Galdieria sulphuraria]
MNYQPIDEDLPTGIHPYQYSKNDKDKQTGDYQTYVPGLDTRNVSTEDVEKGSASSSSRPWLKEALNSIPNQDFAVYTAPLQLFSDLTLQDRLLQIWGCARPWSEFFDIRKFRFPTQGENGVARVKTNLENFFYNYLISCCCFLFVFLFVHPIQVFSLMVCILIAVYFFLWKQEPIVITNAVHLDMNGKLVVLGVTVLLGLLLGHMATILFNFTLYITVVVLLHAFLRENHIEG